jgi:hypothetical protein
MLAHHSGAHYLGLKFAASSGLGRGVQDFSEFRIQKSRSNYSAFSGISRGMWNFRGWCSIGKGRGVWRIQV